MLGGTKGRILQCDTGRVDEDILLLAEMPFFPGLCLGGKQCRMKPTDKSIGQPAKLCMKSERKSCHQSGGVHKQRLCGHNGWGL